MGHSEIGLDTGQTGGGDLKKIPFILVESSSIFRMKYPALWWGWTSKLAQVLNLTTLSSSVKGAKATPI